MALLSPVEKAKDLARSVHKNQFRVAGDTYSDHTGRVNELLIGIGIDDENTLVASHLHHILDFDPNNFTQKILNDFGEEVLQIIKDYKGLTEGNFSNVSPENINESILVQNYLNIAKNPKTLLVRLADKTDNILSAHFLPQDQAIKVAERALYIYSPICKILGITKLSRILDDGAFKILDPKEYYRIFSYINNKFPALNGQIEEVKIFIQDILQENNIPTRIEGRAKSIYSTYKKLKKYQELTDIEDIGAIRIIVDTEDQCYQVEEILNNLFRVIEDSRDDYILQPKQNGYRSLQSAYEISPDFILEIQIRTYEMHEYNEFGLASHAAYKIGEEILSDLQKHPSMLKEISYSLNKEKLNIQQFSGNVYVYTPKGDIKKFIRGANIIDFAYSIHFDVGNGCIGATVNGEFKPVTYELHDGDRIDVKVDKSKKKPSPKWLDLAKTYKAKNQIRKALKES